MQSKTKVLLAALLMGVILIGASVAYPYLSQHFQLPDHLQSDQEVENDPIAAPSISFLDPQGQTVSLEDFKGKIIVLNFWSSQCNPCKIEMPDMQKAYEQYHEDVHFVMINVLDAMYDTRETATSYMQENQYTLPYYFDDDHQAIQTYGVNSFPTTYVIDQSGNLYARGIGIIDYDSLSATLNTLLQQ